MERGILKILEEKIPVPQIFYYDSSCCKFSYPFMLLRWVPGVQLSEILNEYKNIKLNAAHEIGALLAKIHNIKFTSPGFFDETYIYKNL